MNRLPEPGQTERDPQLLRAREAAQALYGSAEGLTRMLREHHAVYPVHITRVMLSAMAYMDETPEQDRPSTEGEVGNQPLWNLVNIALTVAVRNQSGTAAPEVKLKPKTFRDWLRIANDETKGLEKPHEKHVSTFELLRRYEARQRALRASNAESTN